MSLGCFGQSSVVDCCSLTIHRVESALSTESIEAKVSVHRAVDNLLIASTRIQLVIAKAIESMSTAKRKILEYGH